MLFSIIIPVYNVEPYLRQCLDSVIHQDYSDYEIICINDGSTDNSLAILKMYSKSDNRIKIINQKNCGLSAARNAGILEATGDYILFLDSDDWLEQNALQILAVKQYGEDLVCFNGRRAFEDGKTEMPDSGIVENNLTGWDYYNKYALVSRKFHFVCTVLRMYKRKFLIKNNLLFNEGILHEDNHFTPIICYFAQSVRVIPDILYIYRIRKGSIMQSQNVQRLFDMIKVANKLSSFFIPIQNIEKQQLYREIAGEYFAAYLSENKKIYGNNDNTIKKLINWKNFRTVCIYPRHKLIYFLLYFHPTLFRTYIKIEKNRKRL